MRQKNFSVCQVLRCSNGGLIIARHNKIRDEIVHLPRKDFYPHCVRGKPLTHQGRSISEGDMCHGRIILETRGNVLIRGLWDIQTDAIIDIRFRYSDAETYVKEVIDQIFPRWEKMNVDKNGKNCHEQRFFFLR